MYNLKIEIKFVHYKDFSSYPFYSPEFAKSSTGKCFIFITAKAKTSICHRQIRLYIFPVLLKHNIRNVLITSETGTYNLLIYFILIFT